MIIERFEDFVKKTPNKIAIKTEECSLTYNCLNQYANRLSWLILEKHPEPIIKKTTAHEKKREIFNRQNRAKSPPQTVALLLGHDEKMIIGMMAVLKLGDVYIPFDPIYPEERLKYMLVDSAVKVIITNKDHLKLALRLRDKTSQLVSIISIDDLSEKIPVENLNIQNRPDQIAYILYTSGSTGRPIGVVQTRKNIFYYSGNWTKRFSVTDSDRMTLFSTFCHDGSVPDIYSVLLNGATMYPYDIKNRVNIDKPGEWLIKEKITIWHSVPTLYRYFVTTLSGDEKFHDLRLIILGGEQVREYDLIMFKKYFPYSRFGNIYGQTESTVNSIWLSSQEDHFEEVIIGEPIDDTQILIIDEEGNEVDELETGEIVIASPSLAAGYLNCIEATKKAFVSDPELGQLYWTGDLGQLLPDGNIEIIGRKDFQVKILGYRIEPGEIETVLLQHPDISEAVVLAKKAGEGIIPIKKKIKGDLDQYLCVYFVSKNHFNTAELREYLSGRLPYYMVPSHFIKMDTMPLTANGKIDRKSLDSFGTRLATRVEYVAPKTDMEHTLTDIWKEVLKLDKVGVKDNFFDLGANSIDVILLNNKLKETLKIDIPVISIYRYFTINSFIDYLMKEESSGIFEAETDSMDEEIEKSKRRLREKSKRIGILSE